MSDDDPFLHDPTAFEKLIIAIEEQRESDRDALPEALGLIERLIARRVTIADSRAWDAAVADAAAFLARVREHGRL